MAPESSSPRRAAIRRWIAIAIVAAWSVATPAARPGHAGDLVPIGMPSIQRMQAAASPALVPIGAASAASAPASATATLALPASTMAASTAGLPQLRAISSAALPPAEPRSMSAAAARADSLPAIRSLPIASEPPRRTAGMAALGLSPIQPAAPAPALPPAPQLQLPQPTQPVALPLARSVAPPLPDTTSLASLPTPRPLSVSYAPLPVAPQANIPPNPPAGPLPPMLPPPLPVAALPPPLPVAPPPVLPPPLPVPAAPIADQLPPASAAVADARAAAAPPAVAPPQPLPAIAPPVAPAAPAAGPPPSGKPADAVMIASFNIQVFGESKLAKPQVVDVLTKVVRQFDIVAVQEVRAKSDSVVPSFVAAVNADGSRYQYVIGPRLGRTVSKEQYTFIYDTTRIELDPSSVDTLPNPGGKFHRPPLRARFRVRTTPPEAAFSFWLVDIHTDPDEVPQEVDALADAFVSMRSLRPDEDDVIVLGDLNAGPPQFGRIRQIPGIGWAVSGVTTNTRRTKTYDNLIFDRTATTEYTGRWGVLDLQDTFRIPLDKALEVSDHNPVWAAFSPWESRPLAGQAPPPR
jgi:endonuclease/exonuclease/phosphatase family metal-dependent hydrolase